MAEQIFNISSGFYNAVNGDRTYNADDMNKPYKRVLSDGVFATQYGTPSTDFQVVENSGMNINVLAGNAIVAHKWMESQTITPITVPSNTGLSARTDGVFLQVNNSTRTGNIVYKSGDITPSTSGKTEYLIAKVTVASGATSITQSSITDMRGSESCPWVTGLITQVDTSALFAQYQTAYAEQFAAYDQQIQQNISEAQQEWSEALADLSGELTVSSNITVVTSLYSATGTVTTIPIQIAGYDSATDELMVFINGMAAPSSYYTLNGSNIELTNAINSGDTVLFVCFKALINGSIASATVLLQQIQQIVSEALNDTGWVTISPTSGSAGTPAPRYRSIGGKVTVTGCLTGTPTSVCVLPSTVRPSSACAFIVPRVNGSTVNTALLQIAADGTMTVTGAASGDTVYLDCSFLSGAAAGWGNALPDADSESF